MPTNWTKRTPVTPTNFTPRSKLTTVYYNLTDIHWNYILDVHWVQIKVIWAPYEQNTERDVRTPVTQTNWTKRTPI